MAEWKAAPRASKEAEQKLWERFRAAQDAFFTRRSEVFSARDAEQQGNLERKQALLAEAEALDVDADPRAAQAKLREIQAPVARRRPGAARGGRRRSTAGCARSRRRSATRWTPPGGAPTPEANPLLAQMREQVAEAEQRLARAQAAGDAKRIREAEQALAAKRQFLELAEHAG